MPYPVIFVLSLIVSTTALAAAPNGSQIISVAMPGGGKSIPIAFPAGSPVKFDKMEDYGLAHFSGQFSIEGEYRYGRLSNDPNDEVAYDLTVLEFVPDAAYRAVLPYWSERGPVASLSFENETDFIAAVIGPSLIKEIKTRKRLAVTGRAAIWVDRYTAAFECDVPTYNVHFLKVDRPPTVVASNNLINSGCL